MNKRLKTFKETTVSLDRTHHLINGIPFYKKRFLEVLPFHAPGLAPVLDTQGAYHITLDGHQAYTHRFQRTFGFYEDRAAVITSEGQWKYILPEGLFLSPGGYSWCGNFQEGLAPVRTKEGEYFHILLDGTRAYNKTWRYTGDFREGYAVIQREDGLHSHITPDGKMPHGRWFIDLDIFHKGLARAKDETGWMHISRLGEPVYSRRFAQVEPFYNGQARVERFDGALEVIDETGATILELRPARHSDFAQMSSDLVGFWRTETLCTTVELGVIESIPGTVEEIAAACAVDPNRLTRLLRALAELGVVINRNGIWTLTGKGEFLRRSHPLTLADAAIEYGRHFTPLWKMLPEAIKNYGPWQAPDTFGRVAYESGRAEGHHRMLRSYALHDYKDIPALLELQGSESIIDAGGGLGCLAGLVTKEYPGVSVAVLERPEVCELAKAYSQPNDRITYLPRDLFKPWGLEADVVILARVIHDWDDTHALAILSHAYKAVKPGGKLFILEMTLSDWNSHGGLCDLHLLTVTGGKERTPAEYASLLEKAGFRLIKIKPSNTLTRVMTCQKETELSWTIPPSVEKRLPTFPENASVAVLIRHSVRPYLAPGEAGHHLPLTREGTCLAESLGQKMGTRLCSLHTSPLVRCCETAEALKRGAKASCNIHQDRLLGNPGIFVYDSKLAGPVWMSSGHESVMTHLVSSSDALPGMAVPDAAARYLVHHMLAQADGKPGFHVFITHDSLITTTVARLLDKPLRKDFWPRYLEAAFFWREGQRLRIAYKDMEGEFSNPKLCSIESMDVVELARREIGHIIGLECPARFFFAGGAFKSLLHGRPPRDIDLWVPTERDKEILIKFLLAKGAYRLPDRPYVEAFKSGTIEVEVKMDNQLNSLEAVISGFDLILSAIGVEHLGNDRWQVYIHPQALESYLSGKVLLQKPLKNWRHSLATLVRMREYGLTLGLDVPASEVTEIWNIFDRQPKEMQLGMIERFERSAHFDPAIKQEAITRMKV